MAKITFNGKDRTTPFTWKGKLVVKLTLNGKVCTLNTGTPPVEPPTPTGGFCGVMEHTYPNGFGYSGTWPAAQQSLLDNLSTLPADDKGSISIPDFTGVTSLVLPWPSSNIGIWNNGVVCVSAPNANGIFNVRSSTLESLNIPEVAKGLFAFLFDSPIKTLNAQKLVTPGGTSFTAAQLSDIDLPSLAYLSNTAQFLAPITNINLPVYGTAGTPQYTDFKGLPIFHNVVNAASTTVTLPSKFNTDNEKDKLFGPGNWNKITFTWV